MKKGLLIVALIICALGLTACGKKKTEEQEKAKHYAFNELDLGLKPGDDVDRFTCKGNEIYFLQNVYPDYSNDAELYTDDAAASTQSSEAVSVDTAAVDDSTDQTVSVDGTDAASDDTANDATADDTDAEGVITDSELVNDDYSYNVTTTVKKYNLETGEVSDVYTLENNEYMTSAFCVLEDGSMVFLFDKYDYDEKTEMSFETLELAVVGADGTEKSRKNVTELFEGYDPETCYFSTETFDKEGNLYLGFSDGENKYTMLCIAPDGTVRIKLAPDKQIDNVYIDSKNNIIAMYYDKEKTAYAYVDPSTGKFKEELAGIIDEDSQYAYYEMIRGDELNEIYLKNSNSLYSYNAADAAKKLILNWNDCNLVGDNINTIIPTGGGKFFVSYYSSDGVYVSGLLEETDEEVAEKEIIKYAEPYMGSDIKELIVKFNKQSDKYKVEYNDYDDVEDAQEALNKDIIAGNIPDVIGTANVDIDNYIAKGILEDLTPYMESDDMLNKDYFVDGLLDATKKDGKLYYIVDSFNITTLAGKKSDLAKYADGWKFSDVIEYYKSKPEGTHLTQYDSRSSLFYNFCSNSINDFVNWDTGEVHFDSKEFKDIVSFCAQFPSDEEYDENDYVVNLHSDIRDGKILVEQVYMSDTDTIQMTNKLFDDDIIYVGYPCSEGYGSYLIFNESYSIASASSNKEGAWEFIKYIMQNSGEETFPASKEAFEKMVKKDMITESYTDENGDLVEPRNYETGYEEGDTIKITPATKEEIDLLRDIIKRSKPTSQSSDVSNMVSDDLESFFNGQKGLDESIKVLQDKMTKYVNENK